MDKNYEIGHGKPPKWGQFKPGQSGNPKGRPKGKKSLLADLNKVLNEKVKVTEGDKQVTITKQEAMFKSLLAKAHKGDIQAIQLIYKMTEQYESQNLLLNEPPEQHAVDIKKVLDGLGY